MKDKLKNTIYSVLPKVSVIMPVYNAELYLDDTIQSILNQSFLDFEFLIIDDKSTDSSIDIIRKYNDPRIKFFKNEINLGYVKSLNYLIDKAQGKYIARQDNDDISAKDRLFIQYNFLENNESVLLCGSNYNVFGIRNLNSNVPIKDKQIKAFMLFNNPICHPTVMVRKSVFSTFCSEKYDNSLCPSEDYALWFEISKHGKIVNLKHRLLQYRIHDNNTSHLKKNIQIDAANLIRKNIFKYYLNHDLKKDEIDLINLLFEESYNIQEYQLKNMNNLFNLIIKQNKIYKKLDYYNLLKIIVIFWARLTLKNSNLTLQQKIKYLFNLKFI